MIEVGVRGFVESYLEIVSKNETQKADLMYVRSTH